MTVVVEVVDSVVVFNVVVVVVVGFGVWVGWGREVVFTGVPDGAEIEKSITN